MEGHAETAANLKKVSVENLIIGMYVAALDRPWLETNFATQGFYLRTDSTIARLKDLCVFVYVDPRRYDSSLVDQRFSVYSGKRPSRREEPRPKRHPLGLRTAKNRFKYDPDVDFSEEIKPAQTALEHAIRGVDACLQDCAENGQLDGKIFRATIEPVVASVLRNKDAASALVRMRKWDDYTYSHSISCAVWAAMLGKELGYPPDEVESLSTGCAIMDIGKTRVPRGLLASEQQLDEPQLREVRAHVEYGIEIALDSNLADPAIIHIIQTHHERFNGSGYPDGLSNTSIPIVGRIAGLVDSYDAMISPRSYANAQPSYQVLLELERNADVLFQQGLVECFVKAVGIFPVGSVVELNTGEVAIVTKQHPHRRLRPQIMLILDENKLPRNDLLITDLSQSEDDELTTWIERELPKDSHGIDVSGYFL
jgi:HD-GYP domain-containing protein (c-di-GMP phosphodiesterase class II)